MAVLVGIPNGMSDDISPQLVPDVSYKIDAYHTLLKIEDVLSGHSSPGYLQFGQQPSKSIRQIPQTSSSGISQRQVATACHSLILTFMVDAIDGVFVGFRI